jgi:putative SOS response-associated peptidase YedK
MVSQDLKSLARKFGAVVDYPLIEDLFTCRLSDDSIKIARALEFNFATPATAEERRIHDAIAEYRSRLTKKLVADVFRQKGRLANAERSLKTKQTKIAQEDQRIARSKIGWSLKKLTELKRSDLKEGDARIFPFWYAPVLIVENNEPVIRPMRYHCRPAGKPANYDRRYPGLYNARRDNLDGFWKEVFGHHHAVCVMTSFFENVARHDFEKRALREGEPEQNLILHFNPSPPIEMQVACLWDRATEKGRPDLYSFAAITDEPPPEVAATGHNRCIIPLKSSSLHDWLDPASRDKPSLFRLLDDREQPFYAHELAA